MPEKEKKDRQYTPIEEAMKSSFQEWKRRALTNDLEHVALMQEAFDFMMKVDTHLAHNECKQGGDCHTGGIMMATISTALLAATTDDRFTREVLMRTTLEHAGQIVAISKNGPMVRKLVQALMSGKVDISAIPLGPFHKKDFDRAAAEMGIFDDFVMPPDQEPCPDCNELHPSKEQVTEFLKKKLGVH